MQSGSLRKTLYKVAWDTRCRNIDVARILHSITDSETTVIDAGCGEYGLSEFVSAKSVVGVDILAREPASDGSTFVRGSIVCLPFAEQSFSIAASVDVLEHLPTNLRLDAVRQLILVAKESIIITFPSGELARSIDENYNTQLIATNQPIPDWLSEHLENPYPETDVVVADIQRVSLDVGRKVRTSIHYSENLSIAKLLRWSAARSRYLYLIVNLSAGLLLPLFNGASKGNAYRSIVLAEFENE